MIDRSVNTYFGVCAYFRKVLVRCCSDPSYSPTLCRIAVAQTGNFPTLIPATELIKERLYIRVIRGDYRSNVTIKEKEHRLHIITR